MEIRKATREEAISVLLGDSYDAIMEALLGSNRVEEHVEGPCALPYRTFKRHRKNDRYYCQVCQRRKSRCNSLKKKRSIAQKNL